MADYIYLLETRLSQPQRAAISTLRDIARDHGITLFLVGGAVRDLTSGSPVRDLDVVVQGNALKLKKDLEKGGAAITGEVDPAFTLFTSFPGNVRMEVGSALTVSWPKPGKPLIHLGSIQDDLRRRDFTANAMAISLNDGSYGLLMDPLNGVADIENRELRLVSSYGFIEDPVRMIRAARLMARLGWHMDEKTQARYETGKQESYISAMSGFQRGYETEEIFHEEDPLRVLRGLETEGWLQHLAPFLSSSKVNTAELDRLRETQTQLQMQNIHPNTAVASFPYLTARLSPQDLTTLKKSFPSQHFVAQIESSDARTKEFAAQLTARNASAPSQFWKLMYLTPSDLVLSVAHTTKSAALQNKFKSFFTEWPQVRQKLPYTLMQEMRITTDLPIYQRLLEDIFFELLDSRLSTSEEMKAFLEPHSPPAPPPPVHLRRPRPNKKEPRVPKSRKKAAVVPEAEASPENSEVAAPDLAAPVDSSSAKPAKAAKAKSAPPASPVSKIASAPAIHKTAAKVAPAPAKASAKKSAPPARPQPPAKAVTKKSVTTVKLKAAKRPAPPSPKRAKSVPSKKSTPANSRKAPARKPATKPAARPAVKKVVVKSAPARKPTASKAKPAPKKAARPALVKGRSKASNPKAKR